jgi:threonine efflux protein
MDLIPSLLHIALIHILMAMVPGPNTVVVSFCSAGTSRGAGLRAAGGVAAASFVWASLSLAGVGVLLANAGDVFRLMRVAGAIYLVWVGIKMLRSRPRSDVDARKTVYGSPFLAGVFTTLSNPKSAVFWTSVFAVVIPAHAPAWFFAAVLAVVTLQSFLWYGTVALALSSPFSRNNYARLTAALNRVAGSCMVLFGLKIANDVRAEIAAKAV